MAHRFQLAHAPADSFQGGIITNQELAAGVGLTANSVRLFPFTERHNRIVSVKVKLFGLRIKRSLY
ncbi:hypothetical protein CEG88_02155 [Klebsiella aerogenes]|nr:hypothetical protein YA27_20235 [Klebsiella aerogenes]KLF23080.1 hypothetical protein YA28_05085 [Klebsiella aerogenes]KLF55455.1 hypothetical protein YA35_11150 [Klebsiella aerogenes]KZR02243.1 hypothetical protein A3N63_02725 [Klebsiella aerogenes]OWP46816.1 hypothetical protein CEG88_02155 [Klebsiella aerogenes]